jgi:four helix bundle protein
MGSASEVEYLLLLARDLKYASANDYERLHRNVADVKRMTAALLVRLKTPVRK